MNAGTICLGLAPAFVLLASVRFHLRPNGARVLADSINETLPRALSWLRVRHVIHLESFAAFLGVASVGVQLFGGSASGSVALALPQTVLLAAFTAHLAMARRRGLAGVKCGCSASGTVSGIALLRVTVYLTSALLWTFLAESSTLIAPGDIHGMPRGLWLLVCAAVAAVLVAALEAVVDSVSLLQAMADSRGAH